MRPIELSIIIVNYHSAKYTLASIKSICDQTAEVSYEMIVVDNASFDECGQLLVKKYPQVTFVQSARNVGFARANNLGYEYARGTVLLFLNPDTEVQDRAIDRLYKRFKALDEPGVVGCRLINSDRSLQTCCVQPLPTILNQILDAEILQRFFPKYKMWISASSFENSETPVEVEAISGACMMIRRDVFNWVGGFSPDYFMYTEDLDLCYKTRRDGFKNYYIPEAVIVHHGGGSSQQSRSSFSTVMMRESVSRFLRKSHGGVYSVCYRIALGGAAVVRLLFLLSLLPVYLLRRRLINWRASFRKWLTILRWVVGLELWSRKCDQAATVSPKSGKVSSCVESAEN